MSIVLGFMAISIKQLALFAVVIMTVSAVAVTVTADASDAASTEDGFEFQAAGDSAFITKYTGNEAVVKIPSTVSDGTSTYNVVGINDSVFYAKNMVEVIIPETWVCADKNRKKSETAATLDKMLIKSRRSEC